MQHMQVSSCKTYVQVAERVRRDACCSNSIATLCPNVSKCAQDDAARCSFDIQCWYGVLIGQVMMNWLEVHRILCVQENGSRSRGTRGSSAISHNTKIQRCIIMFLSGITIYLYNVCTHCTSLECPGWHSYKSLVGSSLWGLDGFEKVISNHRALFSPTWWTSQLTSHCFRMSDSRKRLIEV